MLVNIYFLSNVRFFPAFDIPSISLLNVSLFIYVNICSDLDKSFLYPYMLALSLMSLMLGTCCMTNFVKKTFDTQIGAL